jgi:pimeloyl-[acyl-carrier protein] methyl ester esterase
LSRAEFVLLHGWGHGAAVWQPIASALGARAITPDLPGESGARPFVGARLQDWTDALAPGLPDAAIVCGWSLGALVALDLAARWPAKAARLLLVGATPCFVARPGWPHGLAAQTVAGFLYDFAHDPAAILRRFLALEALGDARRSAVTRNLERSLARADAARLPRLRAGLQILVETDLRAQIGTIGQTVRLLHGAGDALMPVTAAEWLADALPDGRLSVFEDCGHAPFLSRPAECAALLRALADA